MYTKDKILRAALEMFVENGIHKTSTNSIAKRAGLGAGTIFIYFKTKQELVDELYFSSKINLYQNLANSLDSKAEIKTNFYSLLRTLIEYYLKSRLEFGFHKLVREGIDISKKNNLETDSSLQTLFEFLDEGIKLLEIKNIPKTLLLKLIWNSAMEVVDYLTENNIDLDTEYLDLVWDLVRRD